MSTQAPPRPPVGEGPRTSRNRRRARYRRRRILAALGLALLIFFGWVAFSLGGALTNPALGTSIGARFAEWARDHGGASLVTMVENEWYKFHQPPKGGKPPKGAIPVAGSTATTVPSVGLPVPAAVVPPASPPLPGEGVWHPAGRTVDGVPGLYEAFVRPDPIHTSLVAGIVWMDTKLLHPTLYSGSYIPGGGPYTNTAPIPATAQSTLVSAFNAGFRMQDARGGYYTDGKIVPGYPLVDGAASFVIYKNGSSTVADWGRDATLTPAVVSVRQNLALIVDGGAAVPGLIANDNSQWGSTLGGAANVWRSGLGVTANGALVYVAGPGLTIVSLADLLVRAGAVRAMELDINTDWVQYSTYDPVGTGPAIGPSGVCGTMSVSTTLNGTCLMTGMVGTPQRYFESWWSRDFITMSATSATSGTQIGRDAGSAAAASSTSSTAAKKASPSAG